jgi:1,4-alpha-glucan branching enzyme
MHKDDPDLHVERGMALHKMIRLFTISLGGDAYMNFMGNEFGHPEWIDFPREGNGWSYKHCRRQWSLVDNKDLKYQFLDAFDKAMIKLVKDNRILSSMFAQQLNMDEWNKTIVFERNNLIFLFNFHINHSVADYGLRVPKQGTYKIILNSDSARFGGHERIDESINYETYQKENDPSFYLNIYNTNRTAIVMKRMD